MDLQQVFEEYANIAIEFKKAIFAYVDCFTKIEECELKEQILNEKFSLEEREILENEIKELANEVSDTFTRLLNHTNVVKAALEKELYANTNVVRKLNYMHVKTLKRYAVAISDFIDLEKEYPNHNFKDVIDIVNMTRQFGLLNKAIDDFNFRLMSDSKVKLMTADECIAEAEEILGPGNKIQGDE